MYKLRKILVFIMIFVIVSSCALADGEVIPLASGVINSASVSFTSSGRATFSLVCQIVCSSLEVSSCTLQKKNGSRWEFEANLLRPSGSSNSCILVTSADYSASLKSGNTYRIVVEFNADGATTTCTSNSITY